MPDPWSYAEKTGKEHAHQASLFMWANMSRYCGLDAANDPLSYTKSGHAASYGDLGVKVPQFKWLHAIHNQGNESGQVGKIRGSMAVAEGVKAGVYDMFLPVCRQQVYDKGMLGIRMGIKGFAGLYLELKVGTNKPSDKQNEFSADMRAAGYATEVAWGWLEARNKLLAYLGLPLYG